MMKCEKDDGAFWAKKEQQIQDDFNEAQKNAQMMATSSSKNKSIPTSSKQDGVIYGKLIKSNSETRPLPIFLKKNEMLLLKVKFFDIELRRGKAKGKLFGNIKPTDYFINQRYFISFNSWRWSRVRRIKKRNLGEGVLVLRLINILKNWEWSFVIWI